MFLSPQHCFHWAPTHSPNPKDFLVSFPINIFLHMIILLQCTTLSYQQLLSWLPVVLELYHFYFTFNSKKNLAFWYPTFSRLLIFVLKYVTISSRRLYHSYKLGDTMTVPPRRSFTHIYTVLGYTVSSRRSFHSYPRLLTSI